MSIVIIIGALHVFSGIAEAVLSSDVFLAAPLTASMGSNGPLHSRSFVHNIVLPQSDAQAVSAEELRAGSDELQRLTHVLHQEIGQQRQRIVLQAPVPQSLPKSQFLTHVSHVQRYFNTSTDESQAQETRHYWLNGLGWFCGLAASITALVGLTVWGCQTMQVEYAEDDALRSMRGDPAWTYCCGVTVIVSVLLLFLLAFLIVVGQNEEIRLDPKVSTTMDDGEVVEGTRHQIENPGLCAFLVAQSLLLSIVVACFTIAYLRYSGMVQIRNGLLAKFMIRGATLSLIIAMILESLGFFALGLANGPITIIAIVGMLIVGISEETAKAFAFLWGTYLNPSDARRGSTMDCCLQYCPNLVESARALILAGISVGFGFMAVENALYVLSATLTPAVTYESLDDDEYNVSVNEVYVITFVTVITRLLCNIHPLLTALSAARMAHIAFSEQRGNLDLSFTEYVYALWPSALAHAAFDFALLVAPGIFILVLPLLFFILCWVLNSEWSKAGPEASQPSALGFFMIF